MSRGNSDRIRGKTLEGTAWLLLSSGSRKAIGFIGGIVLARVLFPADFGIIAAANVLIALLGVFDGFGVAAFLIYKGKEGHEHANTAVWLSAVVGVVLTIMTFSIAPWVAAVYRTPELLPVLRVMSLIFIFGSLNPVPRSILRRDLRFPELARRNLVLDLFSTLFTVTLALSGMGVWSFVYPALAKPLLSAVFYWRLCSWRPRLQWSASHLRDIISYGRYIAGSDLVEMALRYADFMLIGYLLGARELGIYSFAYFSAVAIAGYIEELSRSVAYPILATIRSEGDGLQEWGNRFIRALALLVFPALAGQWLVAHDYLVGIYGERWIESVAPFRLLIALGLVTALSRPAVSMLRAAGRPDIPFRVSLVTLPMLAGSLYFCVPRGIVPTAAAVTLVLGASRCLIFALGVRTLHLSASELVRAIRPPLFASLFFCASLILMRPLLESLVPGILARLIVQVCLGSLLYFLFLSIFYRDTFTWGLRQMVAMIPGRRLHEGERT